MPFQEQQLAQGRFANTTNNSVYSPAASTTAIIKSVVICNQSGAAATFRIFLDDNGTTWDATTALYYDVSIAAATTIQIDTFWPMNDAAGSIAFQNSVSDALTITLFGAEIT